MPETATKPRSSRNRTLRCSEQELVRLRSHLLTLNAQVSLEEVKNKIIHQDIFTAAAFLPPRFADLLFLDPPYNLNKDYNGEKFSRQDDVAYAAWFEKIILATKHTLKKGASVYVCADWKTSIIVAPILAAHFQIKNRITWEREKGLGGHTNWKNNVEDIWFCVTDEHYFFNVDAVKLKRKVVAPYRQNGQPKDWQEGAEGNYRITCPSNVWTDISIPFWSMPENTDHPTQKPEKLLAKLLLASSKAGDTVFDPFVGSGSSAVVAKKLRRDFVGVERNQEYCCWGVKRLLGASHGDPIQGYAQGVFWERNSLLAQQKRTANALPQESLL